MPQRQCLGDTTYFHLAEPGTSRCKAHSWRGHWPTTSPSQRGYGDHHRKRKAEMVKQIGHCQCQGCVLHYGPCRSTTRLERDHILNHKAAEGAGISWDSQMNEQLLCHDCHWEKTKREIRRSGGAA